MASYPSLDGAKSQLRAFIRDHRFKPEEAQLPLFTEKQFREIRADDDPELIQALAMLPSLPAEIKQELFSLYLSAWNEFVYGDANSMDAYRTALSLGEGFAANPSLTVDEFLAIKLEAGETSQNLWNNPSTPPEKIYEIYKHRSDEIDEAANPPAWYHWSNKLQGQTRLDAEISNVRSGWGRIQAAIKSQTDADRFDSYLEAHS